MGTCPTSNLFHPRGNHISSKSDGNQKLSPTSPSRPRGPRAPPNPTSTGPGPLGSQAPSLTLGMRLCHPPASRGLDARGSQEPPFWLPFWGVRGRRAFREGAKALGGVGSLISEVKEEPGSSARRPWGWKRGSHPDPVSWARGEGRWGSHGAGFRREQGTRSWHPWHGHGHGRLHCVVSRALRTSRERHEAFITPGEENLRFPPCCPSPSVSLEEGDVGLGSRWEPRAPAAGRKRCCRR